MSAAKINPSLRIGIVSALDDEAKQFSRGLRRFDNRSNIKLEVVQTGVGLAIDFKRLQDAFNPPPKGIIIFGTSGGLDSKLKTGDLLIYEQIEDADNRGIPTSKHLNNYLSQVLSSLNPRTVRGFTATQAICSAGAKHQIRQSSGCASVDMESARLANWALANNIPTSCLRAIVDTADQTIPSAALKGMRDDGKTDGLATFIALCRKPQQLPAVLRLAWQYKKALSTLSEAAVLIIEDLNTRTATELDRMLSTN